VRQVQRRASVTSSQRASRLQHMRPPPLTPPTAARAARARRSPPQTGWA
jgi:hypothetical protein